MVQSDSFHGRPVPNGARPNSCRSMPRIDRHGGLFTVELKRHFSWCSCRSIAKATFLMAKGDGFHGSEGRKATFFIVQRRQLSWILEPVMATFFMAPRWANLFNRFLEERAIATFFMVRGRQAFSKTGQKRAQRGLLRPSSQALSTFGTLWQAPVSGQLTKSRWVRQKLKQRFSLNQDSELQSLSFTLG
jgi:hypothetical protein